MENKPDYSKMMESLFEPTGLNDEKPSEELAKSVIDSSSNLGILLNVYKKTLGYSLERCIPGKNPGDDCIWIHSDAWIDKHPKRRNVFKLVNKI